MHGPWLCMCRCVHVRCGLRQLSDWHMKEFTSIEVFHSYIKKGVKTKAADSDREEGGRVSERGRWDDEEQEFPVCQMKRNRRKKEEYMTYNAEYSVARGNRHTRTWTLSELVILPPSSRRSLIPFLWYSQCLHPQEPLAHTPLTLCRPSHDLVLFLICNIIGA